LGSGIGGSTLVNLDHGNHGKALAPRSWYAVTACLAKPFPAKMESCGALFDIFHFWEPFE
jgi:hypothetical protein